MNAEDATTFEQERDAKEATAKARADAVIAKRATIPDIEGLDVAECLKNLGPEGGEFSPPNEWCAESLAKLPEEDKQRRLEDWKAHERLLPVYYEYARQSPKLLHLAAMRQTIEEELPDEKRYPHKETGERSTGGSVMHPLDELESEGIKKLHSRIGGFAEAVIRGLGKHLIEDRPFPLIPVRERKRAVSYAVGCNECHRFMGPWVTDAGPVSDPWVAGLVSHDDVRLAYKREATTTVNIPYPVTIATGKPGETIRHEHVIPFDGALHATTADGRTEGPDGKPVPKRVMDENGGEIIAFRLNWKNTRDSELEELLGRLIKQLRPKEKWPERAGAGGTRAPTGSKAALNALVKIREHEARKIAWREMDELKGKLELEFRRNEKTGWPSRSSRDELEARLRQIDEQINAAWQRKQASAVPGGRRAVATRRFAKLNGDDEKPWWASR